jgi:hypothetical protein
MLFFRAFVNKNQCESQKTEETMALENSLQQVNFRH